MLHGFGGDQHWWKRFRESRPRNGQPITEPGGSIDITVHSYVDARFAAPTVLTQDCQQLDIECFEGDFIGVATWRWQRLEDGRTRVSQSWRASPNSLKFKILPKLLDTAAIHSKVIQGGFISLKEYLRSPTAS